MRPAGIGAILLWASLCLAPAAAQTSAADAERLLRSGREDEARRILAAALARDPADARALYVLSLADYSSGRLAEAKENLTRSVAAAPAAFPARLLLSAVLLAREEYEEALPHLEAAHRLRPDDPDAAKLLAIELNRRLRSRDTVTVLRPFLDRNAKDEELYLLLLDAYHQSGDLAAALQAGQVAVRALPDSGKINGWVGFQLARGGEFAAAVPYLEKAIRLEPEDHAAYYVLGDLRLRQDNPKDAERLFRLALEHKPDHGEAYAGLGKALAAQGKLTAAIEELERASSLLPDDPAPQFELSRLYLRAGDEVRAKRAAAEFRRLKQQADEVEFRQSGQTAPAKQ